MRRWLWCGLVGWGCAEVEPGASVALPDEQSPAPAALVPESDAVLPPWFEGALPLAGGAKLTVVHHRLQLDQGDGPRELVDGDITGPPSLSADGRRVAFAHTIGEDLNTVLVLLDEQAGSWSMRPLVHEGGAIDRVALHPDGTRVAFVWAGPTGGVASLWTLDLPDGRPVRRTNKAAYTPGAPPADFVPLPLGAPVWSRQTLSWRSTEGAHQVEVSR